MTNLLFQTVVNCFITSRWHQLHGHWLAEISCGRLIAKPKYLDASSHNLISKPEMRDNLKINESFVPMAGNKNVIVSPLCWSQAIVGNCTRAREHYLWAGILLSGSIFFHFILRNSQRLATCRLSSYCDLSASIHSRSCRNGNACFAKCYQICRYLAACGVTNYCCSNFVDENGKIVNAVRWWRDLRPSVGALRDENKVAKNGSVTTLMERLNNS